MSTIPALIPVAPHLLTLADHERQACEDLDANALAYFSGGAGDEITLRANQEAWGQLQLYPRVLRSVVGGHTRVSLLGRELAHPVLLAPVAFQRMAHADGELATALAAAMQGAGMVLSTQASMPLETIAGAYLAQPQRGPLWFQLYLQHDRVFTQMLIRRAEDAGYEALVLTVDAPCSGARDRERRAGFSLPAGVSAVNLQGLSAPPVRALTAGQSALFDSLMTTAPTWDDIAWLQSITRLPLILKGILHEDDARLAQQAGVAGIIVSNHGGRKTIWCNPMPARAGATRPRYCCATACCRHLLPMAGFAICRATTAMCWPTRNSVVTCSRSRANIATVHRPSASSSMRG